MLTRHEGVTPGTDFNFYVLPGCLGFNDIAAYAAYSRFHILRMNALFHKLYLILLTDL